MLKQNKTHIFYMCVLFIYFWANCSCPVSEALTASDSDVKLLFNNRLIATFLNSFNSAPIKTWSIECCFNLLILVVVRVF